MGPRLGWDHIRDLPILIVMVMDSLTDEVRQESLWTMMLDYDADEIMICCVSREQGSKSGEVEICTGEV